MTPIMNMPRHPMYWNSRPYTIDARKYPVGYPDCSKPETKPLACGGMDSMVSDAPTPHSPPIATPKMARSTIRAVRFREKTDANSIIEYNSTSTIKSVTAYPVVGCAPKRVCTDQPHRQRQR